MRYFKFKRNFIAVLSEYKHNYYIEDIVAFTRDEIRAIEIKLSKSNFIADFKNKHSKHQISNDIFYNRFYFCMPFYLRKFALEYLKNYPYGLLVIDSSRNVIVAKHSKLLKAKKELNKEFF
ncbi:hypothetical protein PQO74_000447 [Campylobacter lari]|uniref:hypothetical protein n=1 Tax=Campylobacter lari TaxID=201 RepID=UPI001EC59DFF|nr:hypothetical protein [Campylobacter lari]EKL1317328.1 hypothetical protein [Campylobacter lari]MCW0239506.1 hypothetical protein [Campylobacter lari]